MNNTSLKQSGGIVFVTKCDRNVICKYFNAADVFQLNAQGLSNTLSPACTKRLHLFKFASMFRLSHTCRNGPKLLLGGLCYISIFVKVLTLNRNVQASINFYLGNSQKKGST